MPARTARLRTQIAIAVTGYGAALTAGFALLLSLFGEMTFHELTSLLLIAIGEAVAVAALAGSIFSRKLARPMETWARAADEIAGGKRTPTFPAVRGPAELRRLGSTLQAMFESLERNERVLAATVAQQSQALAAATRDVALQRDRLARALQGSRLATWTLDVESGVVKLSPEWSTIVGTSPGETHATVDELAGRCDPADVPAYREAVWAVIRGQAPTLDLDHRMRRDDGSHAWIRTRGQVFLRDESGRAAQLVGTSSDVSDLKATEAAARESEARLQAVVDNLPIMINLLDKDFRFLFANRPYLEFFGIRAEEIAGRTLAEVAGPEAQAIAEGFRPELAAGRTVSHTRMRPDRSGRERHFEVRLVPRQGPGGEFDGYYSLIDDVTERWALSRELAHRASELTVLTDSVASIIGRLDLEGRVLYANRPYERAFGAAEGGLAGRRVEEFAGADAQARFDEGVRALREGRDRVRYRREASLRGKEVHLEIELVPERDPGGAIRGVFLVANDITSHTALTEYLRRQAATDPLTGLANKRRFFERCDQALARARRLASRAAVVYLDLDGFKPVNDRLGHDAGDAVLREAASRFASNVRAADTLARLGGDEFAVLVEDLQAERDATHLASKLVAAAAVPFLLPEGTATLSASAGVAVYPRDGEDSLALLRCADTAMYAAKRSGKGRVATGAHPEGKPAG